MSSVSFANPDSRERPALRSQRHQAPAFGIMVYFGFDSRRATTPIVRFATFSWY